MRMIFCYDTRMAWIIVGLGNPGEDYIDTRHNTGRMAVERFAKKYKLDAWKNDNNARAMIARGMVEGVAVVCVLPETYMNKSGLSVATFVKSEKAAERCVVLYDDLDIGLGGAKMSFNRGSGGHKGIESIARSLKTKAFWRIRIGITPTRPSGKMKKPKGEEEVMEFILKKFKPSEIQTLEGVFKRTNEALLSTVTEGGLKAMNAFNTA